MGNAIAHGAFDASFAINTNAYARVLKLSAWVKLVERPVESRATPNARTTLNTFTNRTRYVWMSHNKERVFQREHMAWRLVRRIVFLYYDCWMLICALQCFLPSAEARIHSRRVWYPTIFCCNIR